MAKCLKNTSTGEIKRFSENNREQMFNIIDMVKSGDWEYIPKSEWKKVRPEPKVSKKEAKGKKEKI
jgi:hypothetical protein